MEDIKKGQLIETQGNVLMNVKLRDGMMITIGKISVWQNEFTSLDM